MELCINFNREDGDACILTLRQGRLHAIDVVQGTRMAPEPISLLAAFRVLIDGLRWALRRHPAPTAEQQAYDAYLAEERAFHAHMDSQGR